MSYEVGGRADKSGNKFEIRWAVLQMLSVLQEEIDYVTIEPIGPDEKGVDLIIGTKDSRQEFQQCKGRNGSNEFWTYGDANAKNIFSNWKNHMDRNNTCAVALVSPLAFTLLEDLVSRAKNTDDYKLFYNYQILSAGKETQDFFKNFCKAMSINANEDTDLLKCVSYLQRINYRQWPDSELENIVKQKISTLMIGTVDVIYDNLIALIITENIWAKKIDYIFLHEYLTSKNIQMRNLVSDTRIMPTINSLNTEYQELFTPLKDGFIKREEFNTCIESIEANKSLIIHGAAGIGKSGCTKYIVDYCEKGAIPYIAIKLDKRLPSKTAEIWGKELGLPASIAHCINSVANNKKAVIILDQLDALRWTQTHAREALSVCRGIVEQVTSLNMDRKGEKISIVFVCRTYDLENDKAIKLLLKDSLSICWEKIKINELQESTVRSLIGEKYDRLAYKLRELLKIPSNIYIWQQLDQTKEYNECLTTMSLVIEWWTQLSRNFSHMGMSEESLMSTKDKLVDMFDKQGKLYVIKSSTFIQSCLDFLSSNNFITIQNDKISFAHQSILDSFLAEQMQEKYIDGKNIIDIIGSKDKQTPSRRYQVQMFLQSLLEYDSNDFIRAGQDIFSNSDIRYAIKFVFLEILSQIENVDGAIEKFIVDNCENSLYGDNIVNSVICTNYRYMKLLRSNGILDKWFQLPEKKNMVLSFLSYIYPHCDSADIKFMKQYAFQNQDDDNIIAKCLWNDISTDSDEMFDFRISFYTQYPNSIELYMDFKSLFKNCEMRTIKMFVFLLENKLKNAVEYKYADQILKEEFEISGQNSLEIVKLLLQYIPSDNANIRYSDWSDRGFRRTTVERACVQIIKQANKALIASNPDEFWNIYDKHMWSGSYIYNEIILDAFSYLPEDCSDKVIKHLCNDFNNIFDKTSGTSDELHFAKLIIDKCTKHCTPETFKLLEKTIVSYFPPDAKETYQRIIAYNKSNRGKVDWHFWGDLQIELLPSLPVAKLSQETKNLILVLNRKFPNGSDQYKYSYGHSGWVSSPISGKQLDDKTWAQIITNKKILNKSKGVGKFVDGGFISNSFSEFASSFSSAVNEDPTRMLKLVLSVNEDISNIYIDSLMSGVAYSRALNDVPVGLLEEMLLKYRYDYTSNRAQYICYIVKNRANENWSQSTLDMIKDIAINHKNPELGKPNVTSYDDDNMLSADMLYSNALICVRGSCAMSIASLIKSKSTLFSQFKDIIETLTVDENKAVQLASLFPLYAAYDLDKSWVSEKIISLYISDCKFAVFPNTTNLLFWSCSEHRENVLGIIRNCYYSTDDRLIEIGTHRLVEMFILENEFCSELDTLANMSQKQIQAAVDMAILYLKYDAYNIKAKAIITQIICCNFDFEIQISQIFYSGNLNLDRDKVLVNEIMQSNLGRTVISDFVYYIEKECIKIVNYSDIILSTSFALLNQKHTSINAMQRVAHGIPKLVIALYDATCGLSDDKSKNIANQCLDLWDLMFEKNIGTTRVLSQEIMKR